MERRLKIIRTIPPQTRRFRDLGPRTTYGHHRRPERQHGRAIDADLAVGHDF
jgi:hypothetical protein